MRTEKWRLLLLVGHIPRKIPTACFIFLSGKTFRMRMCICELIGKFYFDGLNPKPLNKKNTTNIFMYAV